ncbi:MAG: AAA family ATPase [Candidatus Sabulitectum sp.]|nr:AAA family ATPase [Candidatus Sabulitectum sp.]
MKLSRLIIEGYKSIDKAGQTIEFGDVTVLLGANGSGKSNLISFFKMLNFMTTGALQTFIGEQGYADSILYFGSKNNSRLKAELFFTAGNRNKDTYQFTLSHASGDTLIFTEEFVTWENQSKNKPTKISLGAGHKESLLYEEAQKGGKGCGFIRDLLRGCQVFQFHDTSSTAKVRNQGYIGDNRYLRSSAGNLAAFLYMLKNRAEWRKYFDRIVRHIQLILPQFDNFILNPSPLNQDYIKLDWKEKNSEYSFGPHQLSDGSLRFMALTALLLQPEELLPKVFFLDEPELGLHPAAISNFAGMVRTASQSSQIVIATQSTRLVDEFDVSEIVVVEHNNINKCSEFRRLEETGLAEWLERYSLSELWEKNVLGGRPS